MAGMSDVSSSKYEPFLQVAVQACDGARLILDRHYGNLRNLEEKLHAGLVSDADRESEAYIFDTIRKAFPSHAILGEETGMHNKTGSNALWLVDPLDGTTNFVHQFPVFCISIGFALDGELVVGVVDAPKLGMRFHAVKGGGAYLNGERIRVSSRSTFHEGLFATGFSQRDDTLDRQMDLVAMTIKEARGIRRAGAAALDLCFVAKGSFDVFWEKNLSPWDMAAGALIAAEAGAVVTDIDGNPFDIHGTSVLCGTPALHAEMLKRMKSVSKH